MIQAAIIHSLIALVILVVQKKPTSLTSSPHAFWWAWSPSMIFVAGISLALVGSSFVGLPTSVEYANNPWITIIWVPIVEEICFRKGFGKFFRDRIKGWLGMYIAALFFALAHHAPSVASLVGNFDGNSASQLFYVPIGPLLLGLICEFIYGQRLGLIPAIVFHALANASGWIFATIDSRWLDLLSMLYL